MKQTNKNINCLKRIHLIINDLTSFFFFEMESRYDAQAGVEHLSSSDPPECWDYRHVPPHLGLLIHFTNVVHAFS
jgi:hypothetical protein